MMLSFRTKRFFSQSVVNQAFRTISICTAQLYPRDYGSGRARNETLDIDQTDIDTIAEVEANLFDNSSLKSSPATAGHAAKILSQSRREARKPTLASPSQKSKTERKEPPTSSSPTLFDTDLNLNYKKLYLNDPLVSKIMLIAKSKKARDQKGKLVIEGRRLILDAIAAGLQLETVLFAQKDDIAQVKDAIRRYRECQIIRVPQQDLRSWSTLVTCPGIIAIFRKPTEVQDAKRARNRVSFPISVVCDNIREPNNLGSIVRTCAAIPCRDVFVTKGCCDPWDTKALRGGCGAQFHVSIRDDMTWDRIEEEFLTESENAESGQLVAFLAENNRHNSDVHQVPLVAYDQMQIDENMKRCVLVIGGETHGISDEAYRFLVKCREKHPAQNASCLHIPISKSVNSLNTASAVTLLLFELRKQLLQRQESDLRNRTCQ